MARIKKCWTRIGLLFAVLMISGCVVTQSPAVKLGDVTGIVEQDGTSMAAVTVILGQMETTTDEHGRFLFKAVPHGVYVVKVEVNGVIVYEDSIVVTDKLGNLLIRLADSVQGNLLSNPGFTGFNIEGRKWPAPWLNTTAVTIVGERALFQSHPENPDFYMFVLDDIDTQSYGIRSEEIPVQVGSTYKASVMARTDGEGGKASLLLEFLDSERKRALPIGIKSTTLGDWQYLEAEAVAPQNAATVRVILYSEGTIIGKSYFYDPTLELISSGD